jgi:Ran GTPase-activating protein 1
MATVFSLKGRALKLDTAADVEPLLNGVDPSTLTEIILEGNTIGVDASKALAKFISQAVNIKVRPDSTQWHPNVL